MLQNILKQNESIIQQNKQSNELHASQHNAQQAYNTKNDKRMDDLESKLESLMDTKPKGKLNFNNSKYLIKFNICSDF